MTISEISRRYDIRLKKLRRMERDGVLRFPDGDHIRSGFDGANGHPYRSVQRLPPHRLDAYAARPSTAPAGSVLLTQLQSTCGPR